jgi:rsbT co-antagonist protein RsbR
MKTTDIDFRKMLTFRPEEGRLLLGEDRLLIFRLDAFATLRKILIDQLGDKLAAVYLTQFGYRCGEGDHKALVKAYAWESELDELGAGPMMHMWEGLVHVETTELRMDRAKGELQMKITWSGSYEAEAHKATFGLSDEPVCHAMAGYASGYGTSFMGKPVIAIEHTCVGKGDPVCLGEIRTADAWGPEADTWKQVINADLSVWRELEMKSKEIGRYQRTLSEIATPIIQVWDGVVVVPVVGVVDSQRSSEMMETLLARVSADAIRCVIFDLTGVEVVDTYTADHIFKLIAATNLLGSYFVLTGIRPEVARTLVQLGVDTSRLATRRTLKEGLEKAFELLGLAVVESGGEDG